MATVLEPGALVDGFRLERRVHEGGMGVLYAVRREDGPDPGFPLLMKVPRLGPGEPAESLITFEIEHMVLAALRGEHVPRFVAAGDLADQAYLVMEYVEGTPLSAWAERAPLPAAEVAQVGGALARALHDLHLQEAIHLDVKPSNVLVRPDGGAVLIDFGLAHHAHYPDLLAEEIRHPVGSAPYMSPEQVVGVRSDPRSDVFSLGVVLYQLATGALPFGSPSSPAGLRKRLYRDPVPPRTAHAEVPPWLQEVTLRCLEPDPTVRYQSAAQVAFDLTHPDQVALTERAARRRRQAGLRELLRWIRAAGFEPKPRMKPSAHLGNASIILAAIATAHANEAQFEALRETVRRLMARDDDTRLACVTVVPPAPELGGSDPDDTATAQRIQHVVLLRHWAEPLALPPGRVSFHAIEARDPAAALLEYARVNGVDHVVIGGPPPGMPLKGLTGTVSTKVAVEAPCTVTVVRARRGAAAARPAAGPEADEPGGDEAALDERDGGAGDGAGDAGGGRRGERELG